ncbi:MAG: Uncharacterised protein [Polaribacter sejongensis]|nr:MAG: Uncharacterised protein [Polaribacter sejongensis]
MKIYFAKVKKLVISNELFLKNYLKRISYSETTSNVISATTALCNLTDASYLPNLFTEPPTTLINFLSKSVPAFAKAAAKSMLFTEPNNLSPEPVLDAILISYPLIVSAILVASSINLASL